MNIRDGHTSGAHSLIHLTFAEHFFLMKSSNTRLLLSSSSSISRMAEKCRQHLGTVRRHHVLSDHEIMREDEREVGVIYTLVHERQMRDGC